MNLSRCYTIADLQRSAKRTLPKMIFDFIEGGAEEEATLRRNRSVFSEITFQPQYLRDVSNRSVSTTIVGTRVGSPLIVAPTGLHRIIHPDGELAVARGAAEAGALMIAGGFSSYTLEEIAGASSGPLWLQIAPWRDRDVVMGLVERAHRAGVLALCLTVDTPVVGLRERDLRSGVKLPLEPTPTQVFDALRHPRWLARWLGARDLEFANFRSLRRAGGERGAGSMAHVTHDLIDPSKTWEEVRWLRNVWRGSLVIKGLLRTDDARRAVDEGADGIVVSNHGGRQLDGAPPTLEMLPSIVDSVGDSVEVFLDSGVRRGTDVVKAIALGARACLVGRPFLYGLAAAGQAGVTHSLSIISNEVDRVLALVGVSRLDQLDRSLLRVPSEWGITSSPVSTDTPVPEHAEEGFD
jgi:isopentenyl diphosphate isomerase/L-lactate dehydrogenase-like FMN-dependent dehydrogenase